MPRTALMLAACFSLAAGAAAGQTPARDDAPSPMSPGHEIDAAQLHERCRPIVGPAMEPRGPRHHGARGQATRLVPPEKMEPLHAACVNELVAREAAAAAPAPKARSTDERIDGGRRQERR
ncbi:hypothetical protein [Phenylobacterium sp.]|uniref:hypothetical protein n=1 Tax=Phenylobacterium sp. TaxID=1871053 RepID=UPI0035C7DF5B